MQTDHSAPRNPGLRDIRNKVKEVMIPLLVSVFEAKMSLQQAQNPSRLHTATTRESPEKLRKQLEELQEDVNMLLLWCQSCKTQIHKALENESPRQQHTISQAAPHPSLQKSFTEAISSQNIRPPAQLQPAKVPLQKKLLQFLRGLKDNPRQ